MRVHMWGKMLLRTCRGVLKELRAVSGGGEAGEQWRFLVSVVRSRGTERHEPQEKEKGLSTLESYLSYLQSSRRHKVRASYTGNFYNSALK